MPPASESKGGEKSDGGVDAYGQKMPEAAKMGDADGVEKYLRGEPRENRKGCDVNCRDWAGFTAQHHAATKGFIDVADVLLRHSCDINAQGNYPGLSAVHKAAQAGWREVVERLMRAGAGHGMSDQFGDTPLHLSSYDGRTQCVEALLAAGAKPAPTNKSGDAPLHQACRNGHDAVCALLLEHRATIDLANNHGRTPLHWTA